MATIQVPNIFRYGIVSKDSSVFESPTTFQQTVQCIGQVTFSADSVYRNLTSTGSQGLQLPRGTTLERPVSNETAYIRFNDETGDFEGHNGTQWIALGALTGDVTLGPNLTIIAPDTGDTGSRIRLTKPPTSNGNDAIVEIVKTLECESVLRVVQNNKVSWASCEDGETSFYFNGVKRVYTTTNGIDVSNGSNIMSVYHDNTNSYIDNNGSGYTNIRSLTNNTGVNLDGTNSTGTTYTGAAVNTSSNNVFFSVYYNGTEKLKSVVDGVDIFGRLYAERLIAESNINSDNVQISANAPVGAGANDIAGISFNKPTTNVQLYHLGESSSEDILKIRKTDGTIGSVYSELNKPNALDTNALPYTATTNNNNGANVDTFFSHGVYRIFNAVGTLTGTNIISGDNDLILFVYSGGDANNITHKIINTRINNSEYIRTRISGSFGGWNGLDLSDEGTF